MLMPIILQIIVMITMKKIIIIIIITVFDKLNFDNESLVTPSVTLPASVQASHRLFTITLVTAHFRRLLASLHGLTRTSGRSSHLHHHTRSSPRPVTTTSGNHHTRSLPHPVNITLGHHHTQSRPDSVTTTPGHHHRAITTDTPDTPAVLIRLLF